MIGSATRQQSCWSYWLSMRQQVWSSTTWSMATRSAHGRPCAPRFGTDMKCKTWGCHRGAPTSSSFLGTSHCSYPWWTSHGNAVARTSYRRLDPLPILKQGSCILDDNVNLMRHTPDAQHQEFNDLLEVSHDTTLEQHSAFGQLRHGETQANLPLVWDLHVLTHIVVALSMCPKLRKC
jgi:hypothetical protein